MDVGISEHTVKVCDASRTATNPINNHVPATPFSGQRPSTSPHNGETNMVKGLATAIYHVTDLEKAKAWYAKAFGQQPYFDQPFYVGFNIGGYELGLNPDQSVAKAGRGGSVAYWRVPGIEDAVQHFVKAGASLVAPAEDVGEGIKVATVADPFGNLIGLIENPHFVLPTTGD